MIWLSLLPYYMLVDLDCKLSINATLRWAHTATVSSIRINRDESSKINYFWNNFVTHRKFFCGKNIGSELTGCLPWVRQRDRVLSTLPNLLNPTPCRYTVRPPHQSSWRGCNLDWKEQYESTQTNWPWKNVLWNVRKLNRICQRINIIHNAEDFNKFTASSPPP